MKLSDNKCNKKGICQYFILFQIATKKGRKEEIKAYTVKLAE